MPKHILRASSALFTLALALPTAAEEVYQLPEVPVIAPAERPDTMSTTVLSGRDLEPKRAATSDTARLLSDVPGVSLYNGAGGVSSLPALHGLADDRVKQVVNGMTITSACPNHMNPALSYTDPTIVGRIEVLPGITPVSNGGDSIGGTIAVESRPPIFAEGSENLLTTGRLSTAYRSTSHGIAAAGDVTAATHDVSMNYAGAWSHAGDYHRGGDNEPVRTSKYQKEDHAVTLAARHDGDLLAVQAGWQFSPYEGFPNQRMDLTENEGWFVNTRYDGRFTWGTLETRAYWQGVRHEMNFLDKIKGNNMPMNTEADDIGYSVKADIPLNPRDTLRVGNELHRFTLDDWWPPVPGTSMAPNDFWNIRDGRRTRLGTFAEWEAQWTNQWSSLLGARNDTVWMNTDNVQGYNNGATYAADAAAFNRLDRARTDVNFDLTALLRYEHDKTASFEGGYARKTRSPNLYERYAWSTGTMASNMNNWNGDGN
ncbi:MAG TPA: TonB-dependent receptor, partial [Magnetospirillum sp.]|nr:TonB-dependent receptor [Magnetospirillum sp.]